MVLVSLLLLSVLLYVCLQFEPLDRVALDIPFLLMTDILSSSPWPLLLASSSLQLLTMTSNTPQLQSQLQEGTWLVFTAVEQKLKHINPVTLTLYMCVCVCDQWFCRQVRVPVSVSVFGVHR